MDDQLAPATAGNGEPVRDRLLAHRRSLMAGAEGITVSGPSGATTIRLQERPGGASCTPTHLVDGMVIRPNVADSTVRALSLSTVLGVEVYRTAAEVPNVFADIAPRCGLIAIWTRRAM